MSGVVGRVSLDLTILSTFSVTVVKRLFLHLYALYQFTFFSMFVVCDDTANVDTDRHTVPIF